ncbi:hypothetical protein [Archangium lansingense]|uniref:Uncharacterized protein n=1 Tax=Archangium lansingense TaxID=2995310 RepID=A0ABT4AJI6_9BACT|nr:hypothetical protein [Archangium lansinium]MCY1081833.1 hypothetical protein [Archangium lansinium]
MSHWESLKNRWFSPARAPAPAASQRVEVAPGLVVSVFRHVIERPEGGLTCWSYVTEGLATHGQKELVLTLSEGPGLEPSSSAHQVFQLFATIQQFASQGRTVNEGGVTRFGQRKFLGRHLLYLPASPLAGVPVPAGALAAILVTDAELTLVEENGAMRLMAALGKAYSHYPYPPWSEPERPELPANAMREASILSKMAHVRDRSARVLQLDGELVLRIEPGAEKNFRQLVEAAPGVETEGFGLLTGFDPTADAWLVWEPGQRTPGAITPPGSRGERIGGCFLAFLPGQKADQEMLVEDGFAWMLTHASWTALLRALTEGQSLALLTPGGKRLRLEWTAR